MQTTTKQATLDLLVLNALAKGYNNQDRLDLFVAQSLALPFIDLDPILESLTSKGFITYDFVKQTRFETVYEYNLTKLGSKVLKGLRKGLTLQPTKKSTNKLNQAIGSIGYQPIPASL